jgi:hypothetical protein
MNNHTNANPQVYVDTTYTHHGDAPRNAADWADLWAARAQQRTNEHAQRYAAWQARRWSKIADAEQRS